MASSRGTDLPRSEDTRQAPREEGIGIERGGREPRYRHFRRGTSTSGRLIGSDAPHRHGGHSFFAGGARCFCLAPAPRRGARAPKKEKAKQATMGAPLHEGSQCELGRLILQSQVISIGWVIEPPTRLGPDDRPFTSDIHGGRFQF